MSQTNNLIIKVISGNASAEEVSELDAWRKQSVKNEADYKSTIDLWENIGKANSPIVTDENKAWATIDKKINSKQKSNYIYLKIAAVFVIFLSVSLIIKTQFSGTEETVITQNIIEAENTIPKINTTIPQYINVISSLDSIKEILLSDSSHVILNTNSEISYKDFADGKTRQINLKGEAYFDIIHKPENFIVTTNKIKVKVIGTAFNVRAFKNDSIIEVAVEEGVVEAFEIKNTKNKIRISAKEKAQYNVNTHKFTKSGGSHKKWWKGFFSKLKKIIDKLKHRKDKS